MDSLARPSSLPSYRSKVTVLVAVRRALHVEVIKQVEEGMATLGRA